MNQNINDGVQAVRAVGQKVLDRVESAAGDVAHEAREAGERLAHATPKARKRDRDRKRKAGLAASAASVAAFLMALVMRKRTKKG